MNSKIGKERPTIDIHSFHEITNDNGTKVIDLAKGKCLRVKNTMFSHKNIHKGTWMSPDGSYSNQIDHILVNKRFANNIMDVKTYRGADCDFDHFLVAGNLRVKLKIMSRKMGLEIVRYIGIEKLKDNRYVREF